MKECNHSWRAVDSRSSQCVKCGEWQQVGFSGGIESLRQQIASANEQAAAAQAENLRLRMFLDQLARLGNEPLLGSSTGNRIAQAALAQQPSRAALDEYVAERVKELEDHMRQWAMENLQSGSPRRESFYAVLEKEVVKS